MEKEKNNKWGEKLLKLKIIDKSLIMLFVLSLITLFMSELFCVMRVTGSSMYPTYRDGDIVTANRFYKKINRNDIIIFYHGNGKFIKTKYIKRVIAIPGDTIIIQDDMVYVNGEMIEDKFAPTSFSDMEKEILLRDNEYFVLGDNRDNSSDSREFGPVLKKDIIGVVR